MWDMFVFVCSCSLPSVVTAFSSFVGDEWMKECSLLKDGGLGVVTMGVKTFPSAHLAIGSNEMLEIDEISIDPNFVGDIAEEKERNGVV